MFGNNFSAENKKIVEFGMHACKTLVKHGKSSVEYYKLKTKTI